MANFDVDTKKMHNAGEDSLKLIQEYNELIDSFFTRINQIPSVTKEWVGQSANSFVKLATQEKKFYISYGKELTSCANVLIKKANELETIVNNNVLGKWLYENKDEYRCLW